MPLIRWEPVAEINTIQNEMNRLFNNLFDTPTGRAQSANATARRWIPAMDLVETADRYVLSVDLPGLSEQDVDVQLEDNVLSISGERKSEHSAEQKGYYRLERAFGGFFRSLTLPNGVDPDSVQAHFDRGVLQIAIPKPEQKKPRQVQISLGTSGDPKTIESAASTESPASRPEPVAAVA